jgi:hypothetical protein
MWNGDRLDATPLNGDWVSPAYCPPAEHAEYERGGARAHSRLLMRHAVDTMVESLTVAREARVLTAHIEGLARDFNALLQEVKEQFPVSDALRLIDPVGTDASVAVIAVRLSLMKRTIDAELARQVNVS